MSVAFTKEESAETASETLLPDRPISPHPNLVTETGLKVLQGQLEEARKSHEAAQAIEDVNERRRQSATPLRDTRYLAERVRTAQVVPSPLSSAVVAFGSTVTFSRGDGRVQKYRIVGEDEADPKSGSVSFVSPSVASVVAGHTQMAFSSTPQVVPHVRDHALRALAVVGKKRSRTLPDTPTMIEAGFPQSQGDQWVGVLAPAGTPKDIVGLLNREIRAAMSLPDTQERFAVLGYEVVGGAPEDLTAHIKADFDIWGKVIRAGNLKSG